MADKLFTDFPEKTTFADNDVSIIADSEDAYKIKKIKKSTMKGDTGASITGASFSGDDILFTKDDATVVTLTDAVTELTGPEGAAGADGAVIYSTLLIPDNALGKNGDRAFSTYSTAEVFYKSAGTWALVNALQGDTGATGATGASITSGAFVGNDLVFTKDDASTVTIVGAKTDLKGDKGDKTIIYSTINIPDNAVGVDGDWAFSTSSTGNVFYKSAGERALVNSYKGPAGADGADGKYITAVSFSGDDMVFTFDDATTETIVGAKTTLTGPAGANGTDGDSFERLGAYSSGTAYVPGQAVSYLSQSYMCKLASTGNAPTDTTYRDLMAAKGTDGAGSGDVMGPATNTDSYIPQRDGANSKTLKDGLAVPAGGLAGLTSPSFTTPDINAATADSIQAGQTSAGVLIKNNDGTTVASFGVGSASSTNIDLIGATTVTGNISATNLSGTNTGDNAANTNAGLVHTAGAETITGAKTFDKDTIKTKGTSTGVTTISTANTSATDYTVTLPAATGTIALVGTDLPLAGGTMTGNITLGENTGVALDPAGSADEKWSGITCGGTAGATVAVGDLLYLDATAGEWLLADADAASTSGDVPLGLCILAANDGQATDLLLIGTIRSAAFPASIALGAPVYVSTTAGDIQAAQPSGADDVIRRVGWAITAEPNTIYFNPENSYITHV